MTGKGAMIYSKVVLFTLFCLLVLPGIVFALDAGVQVDKTDISLEEVIVMQVVVKGDKADVDVSAIRDFKVSPAGTSTRVSIVNGDYDKETIYQYRLVPLKEGTAVIPPLTVKSGGKTVLTKPVTVRVSKTPVSETGQRDIFATAEISAENLVIGQQAVYTFKLFSAVNFRGGSLASPSFSGFHSKEIADRKTVNRLINGREFSVTEVRFLLIPQKTGTIEIEPAVVEAQVITRDQHDPLGMLFDDSFFSPRRTKPVRVAANPVRVTVSPLPVYQGNLPFSGLVGEFAVSAEMDRTDLAVGDSATLTFTVSGTGNIMDAPAPSLDIDLNRFKVYDDSPVENIQISAKGYSGARTFKKAIVPTAAGELSIPGVPLVYFDTRVWDYRTIRTDPIKIDVVPSDSQTVESLPSMDHDAVSGVKKKDVRFAHKDILTIKDSLDAIAHQQPMSMGMFVTGAVLPFIFLLMALAVIRLTKKEVSAAQIMESRAREKLKAAMASDSRDPEYLTLLYTALVSKIMAREGRTGETLTCEEAGHILSRSGSSEEEVRRVTELIETIEAARFSGSTPDAGHGRQLLERTKAVCKQLSICLVCAVVLLSTPVYTRADDQAMVFLDAVKHYHSQEYEAARDRFLSLAEQGVINGKLYYNIGNACLKLKDTGRAILWYERAKKLIPTDPDLLFNLDFAQGLTVDKRDEPAVEISEVLFFWMKFLPLNGIQICAIILSVLFCLFALAMALRRQPVFRTAGILLMCLFVLCSTLAVWDYYEKSADTHAVVISDTVVVRSGLSDNATALFELHAGTRVRVQDTRPGHLKIMFSKDKVGWVKTDEVIPI